MTPAQLLERITPGPWLVMTHYGDERLTDEWDNKLAMVLPECGSYPEDVLAECDDANHPGDDNALAISLLPDLLRLHVAADAYYNSLYDGTENRTSLGIAFGLALAALSDKMKGMK